MMFKVRVSVRVTRNTVKNEIFETMVDQDTFRKCTNSNDKKEVAAIWKNTFFPGAKEIQIMQINKI
jgi:hypothetical protein